MERRTELKILGWALACCIGLAQADMAAVVPPPADPAATLHLPAGFQVNVFARFPPSGSDYFRGPRFMAFGPDNHLYLSLGRDNKLVMLPDRNHDGQADETITISDRLNAPQGLVFLGDRLLVANQDGVVSIENGRIRPFINGLPAGGHTLKSIKLGPDGYLYLNVGSSCNVCKETDPMRATILRYTQSGTPAGRRGAVWAEGLRNSQGFAWHPETQSMYATNDGADMRSAGPGGKMSDDVPPEHLNLIKGGSHYGWPYCWGDHRPDPDFPDSSGICAKMEPPALTLPAHSTPIGITFVHNTGFPPDYQGDALVALHGSWNRERPSGYKVVRIKFRNGKPADVSDFITGWLSENGAWGRPVDVAFGPEGALYVSDDRAGIIYRIVYKGALK